MEPSTARYLVGSLISLLLVSLFVHLGASAVLSGKQRFGHAILAATGGSFLGFLVLVGAGGGALAIILALAAWALVLALVYRTRWVVGAGIGLVGWLIWWATTWLVGRVMA